MTDRILLCAYADTHTIASRWPIYTALKKNANFREQFVLTFMDLINTNLSAENTTAIMKSLGIVNEIYQEYFENRADFIVPYVAEEFELTGTQETVTLSSNVSGRRSRSTPYHRSFSRRWVLFRGQAATLRTTRSQSRQTLRASPIGKSPQTGGFIHSPTPQ